MTNAQMGNTQMTFAYDALNRCVKRTLNGTSTYLCYAGWDLIEEHGSNGNLNVTYVHGANIDEILIKTDANSTVFYHEDALGNVIYLTDDKGNLAEQYRYDAFGTPIFIDANGNIISNSAYGNRFLFTGREWLQELGLYDYRNRIYSVELGRFLQTDPIRFTARDINLYRYVSNNTINWIDPTGLLQWINLPREHSVLPTGLRTLRGNEALGLSGYVIELNPICVCKNNKFSLSEYIVHFKVTVAIQSGLSQALEAFTTTGENDHANDMYDWANTMGKPLAQQIENAQQVEKYDSPSACISAAKAAFHAGIDKSARDAWNKSLDTWDNSGKHDAPKELK